MADTFMLSALQTICKKEQLSLSPSELVAIRTHANGDLRNAVHSLQVFAVGAPVPAVAAASSVARASKGSKRALPSTTDSEALAAPAGQRDRFRDMFHAMSSILHRPGKRLKLAKAGQSSADTVRIAQEQRDTQLLRPWCGGGGMGGFGVGFGSAGIGGGFGGRTADRSASVEGGGGASDSASAIDDFSPEAIVEVRAFVTSRRMRMPSPPPMYCTHPHPHAGLHP